MISGNFSEFDRELANVERDWLPRLFRKVMRAVALAAHGTIIAMTPVDTGRARAGWDVTVSTPSTFVPPEGASSYSTRDISGVLTAMQTMQLGDSCWITNNVVYIRRLNEGWSKQAPAGFVEGGLIAAANQVERMAA